MNSCTAAGSEHRAILRSDTVNEINHDFGTPTVRVTALGGARSNQLVAIISKSADAGTGVQGKNGTNHRGFADRDQACDHVSAEHFARRDDDLPANDR